MDHCGCSHLAPMLFCSKTWTKNIIGGNCTRSLYFYYIWDKRFVKYKSCEIKILTIDHISVATPDMFPVASLWPKVNLLIRVVMIGQYNRAHKPMWGQIAKNFTKRPKALLILSCHCKKGHLVGLSFRKQKYAQWHMFWVIENKSLNVHCTSKESQLAHINIMTLIIFIFSWIIHLWQIRVRIFIVYVWPIYTIQWTLFPHKQW